VPTQTDAGTRAGTTMTVRVNHGQCQTRRPSSSQASTVLDPAVATVAASDSDPGRIVDVVSPDKDLLIRRFAVTTQFRFCSGRRGPGPGGRPQRARAPSPNPAPAHPACPARGTGLAAARTQENKARALCMQVAYTQTIRAGRDKSFLTATIGCKAALSGWFDVAP
jgi:hypothetical protein